MWYVWKTFPTGWNHVIRVVVVAAVLGVAACTTLGGASVPPAGQPPEGGQVRAMGSGNGGGGY
jgi:hypothetical protein